MFESLPRWVLALVGACVLISVLAMLRSGEPEPPAAPRPGSIAARVPAKTGRAGLSAGGGGGFDQAEGGAVVRGGAVPRTVEPGKSAGGGRRLADEPLPGTEEREAASLRQAQARGAGVVAGPAMDTPAGTRLAAPFDGSGESAEQMIPIIDENVYYDVEDGAYFSPDARFAFPDNGGVNNEAGTIAFWIQPHWSGADETDNSLIQLRSDTWPNRLQVFKNGRYLRFLFTDNTGSETNIGISIAEPPNQWMAGEWHQIAVTWGDTTTTLFVDAVVKGSGQYMGKLEVPWGTEFYVGSDRPSGAPGADAIIDDLIIVDHKLTADEVLAEFRKRR